MCLRLLLARTTVLASLSMKTIFDAARVKRS
jgi:hypothetical protein